MGMMGKQRYCKDCIGFRNPQELERCHVRIFAGEGLLVLEGGRETGSRINPGWKWLQATRTHTRGKGCGHMVYPSLKNMRRNRFLVRGISDSWLPRSEGMDPYGSPYITHYSSFHFLFHSFIPAKRR